MPTGSENEARIKRGTKQENNDELRPATRIKRGKRTKQENNDEQRPATSITRKKDQTRK